MHKKKILFLTTASIATNPRLLKAYLFWRKQGHACKIMAFRMHNWSDALDDDLIVKYNIDIVSIPAAKQNYLFWLQASLWNRFLAFFPPRVLLMKFLAFASNKRTWQLMQYLKKDNIEFDHLEAHTLGALYPAYHWSKKKNKTFSFDVEDFHPEEKVSFQVDSEKQRRYRLMRKLLPFAKYVTAASPLIAKETKKLLQDNKVFTINNSFDSSEFIEPKVLESDESLKLVWFSQNISEGRGLDLILDNVEKFKNQISLTLIGNLDSSFNENYLKGKNVKVLSPMIQDKLHNELSNFDIGLVLEKSKEDYNKDICLANKLFAYVQSGLYVIATDTLGHKLFFGNNPDFGILVPQDSQSLEMVLKKLVLNKDQLRSARSMRYKKAYQFNFEDEMFNLKTIIE